MAATGSAGFNANVQRTAGIYPRLDRLLFCLLAKKDNGTSAKTQTIKLPSLYAHRSVRPMPFAIAHPRYGRLSLSLLNFRAEGKNSTGGNG